MAKKLYTGINDTSRNSTKLYIGVNDLSRNAKKAYIGVNNLSRLFWDDGMVIEGFHDYILDQDINFDYVAQRNGRNETTSDYIRLYYTNKLNGDSFAYSHYLIDWSRGYSKLGVKFKLVSDHPDTPQTYGFRVGFDYNQTNQASVLNHTWVSPQFTPSTDIQTYILDLTTLSLNNAYLRLGGVQDVYIYGVTLM